MADEGTPWDVRPPADQTPPVPGMPQFEQIRSQWTNFMDQPGARAMLLQMGTALMQPPSFGDTPASQIGRAMAAGAAAVGRGEEAESKQSEREARSQAAVARAETAGAGLTIRQLEAENRSRQQQAAAANTALRTYNSWVANREALWNKQLDAVRKENFTRVESQKLPEPPRPPHVSFEQWLDSVGSGILSKQIMGAPPGGGGLPGGEQIRVFQGRQYRLPAGADQFNRENWQDIGPAPRPGGGQ